jgi:hypothetical protein
MGLADVEAGLIEAGVNDYTGAGACGGERSGPEIDGCRKAAITRTSQAGEKPTGEIQSALGSLHRNKGFSVKRKAADI